jgi:hypothetical protein
MIKKVVLILIFLKMKYLYLIVLYIYVSSCNTVKVKRDSYKVTNETVDFLAVGESATSINQQNHFESFGFPKLEDKIKLYVEILLIRKI